MGRCTTIIKQLTRKKQMIFLYPAGIILVSSLIHLNKIAWRNASLAGYVREFTNVIPLRGIMDAVMHAVSAGNTSYLRPLIVNLLAMIPVGVIYGASAQRMGFKETARDCVRFAFLLAGLYGIRLLLKLGSFDVDDILLNLVGAILGAILTYQAKQKVRS